MKMHKIFTVALFLLFCSSAFAQAKTAAPAKTISASSKTSKPSGNSSDSFSNAVDNLKTSFGNVFGSKRDTVTITVANIDYDDSNLTALKENIKMIKDVKSVSMQYKSGAAKVFVLYKGVATDLWDKLPAEIKKPFKLTDAGNNNIALQCRNTTSK
jgi:hypothetical protein